MNDNSLVPRGDLTIRKISPILRPAVRSVADALRFGGGRSQYSRPHFMVTSKAQRARLDWQDQNRDNFERSLIDQGRLASGQLFAIGHLWLAKVDLRGNVQDLGLASCRVVTTAGVNFIVDAFQGTVEPEVMKYHAVGTGSTAESVGQTALVTELTTQYSASNTRPTGTLGELAGNANVFETTATISVSATVAITEHAIMSQASNAGGTMLDRSVFSAVNLLSGESLLATYDLTFPSGG
jgi:hypothetical protein